MRVTRLVLLLFFSSFRAGVQAQTAIETTELDSVPLAKPKMHGELYQYTDNGTKEIQYRNIGNKLTKNRSNGESRLIFRLAIVSRFMNNYMDLNRL
jgi:hypothetical protein